MVDIMGQVMAATISEIKRKVEAELRRDAPYEIFQIATPRRPSAAALANSFYIIHY